MLCRGTRFDQFRRKLNTTHVSQIWSGRVRSIRNVRDGQIRFILCYAAFSFNTVRCRQNCRYAGPYCNTTQRQRFTPSVHYIPIPNQLRRSDSYFAALLIPQLKSGISPNLTQRAYFEPPMHRLPYASEFRRPFIAALLAKHASIQISYNFFVDYQKIATRIKSINLTRPFGQLAPSVRLEQA